MYHRICCRSIVSFRSSTDNVVSRSQLADETTTAIAFSVKTFGVRTRREISVRHSSAIPLKIRTDGQPRQRHRRPVDFSPNVLFLRNTILLMLCIKFTEFTEAVSKNTDSLSKHGLSLYNTHCLNYNFLLLGFQFSGFSTL